MLTKLKNPKGFTIIEVMIVLAIAGLIILIVLLAVPALQRNGRNTAIKNDATAITAGIAEFTSNNEGRAPNLVTQTGSDVDITGAGGTTPARAKVQGSTEIVSADPTVAGTIRVHLGQKCNASNGFAVTGAPRSVAVKYLIETATTTAQRCVDA